MTKKRIGIVGFSVGENSFGIGKAYYEYFRQFGLVQILGPDDEIDANLDLLILPGGRDIDPARYGEIPSTHTGPSDPFLEYFDLVNLPQYIDAGVPIFAICRGFQTINVHFGGTLKQHLHHHYYSSDSRDELVHKVYSPAEFAKGGKKRLYLQEVNSLHHQAIDVLGEGIQVQLYSNDGVIEAIKHRDLPIWGVEFHPEEIDDIYSRSVLNMLLQDEEEEEQQATTTVAEGGNND